jgi:hypothetical protein
MHFRFGGFVISSQRFRAVTVTFDLALYSEPPNVVEVNRPGVDVVGLHLRVMRATPRAAPFLFRDVLPRIAEQTPHRQTRQTGYP